MFQLVLFLSLIRLSLLYILLFLLRSMLDSCEMFEPVQFTAERTDEYPRSLENLSTDRTQAFQDD